MAPYVTERSNPLMSNRRLAAVLLSIALTFFLGHRIEVLDLRLVRWQTI